MSSDREFSWLAAAHTPFGDDGEVCLPVIELQAEHLHRVGMSGAFVCGTTGEGLSLSVDERMAVAARWADVVQGTGMSLWVHVGANALPEATALARHAGSIGADAIAVMPPCFYRPDDAVALAQWCSMISGASGGLPFTYYESPQTTGVHVDIERFVDLARAQVPGYLGLKYTHSDLGLFSRLCDNSHEEEGMWWGRDEELHGGVLAGATGAIGSSYNFAAPLYRAVLDEGLEGKGADAAASQADAIAVIEILGKHGYLGAAKCVMEMLGVPVGGPRLPLTPLHEEARAQLAADLEAVDFFTRVRT